MGRPSSTSRSTCSAPPAASCRRSTSAPGSGAAPDDDEVATLARPDRHRRAAGVHRRQRRLLGRRVGRAARRGRAPARALLLQRPRPRHAARPTTSCRSCAPAGLLKQRADLVVVLGTPLDFRLGLRPLRQRPGRPRGRQHGPARRPRRACRRSPATACWCCAALAEPLGRRASTTRTGSPSCAPPRSAAAPPTPNCSRADSSPIKPSRIYGELGKRLADDAVVICDGGDFAVVRRQVRRGAAARLLARHRPVRVPRQRPRLRDRGTRRPARQPGRAAARRRCRRLQPDGRRHARAPRPARGDGRRQQRHVGPREAPDAGHLRLGHGLRSAARVPVRRGGHRTRRRWRARHRPVADRSGARPGVRRPGCPTW